MTLDFEKYAMKGNEFLHHLETNLGTTDRGHAGRILRSTFKVLRNHLSFEESLQLLAQLPMAIKALYVDGWTSSANRRIKTPDEFLSEILETEGAVAWRDFSNKEDILQSARAVIETMRIYVSQQEMDQALATLPRRIQAIFEPSEKAG